MAVTILVVAEVEREVEAIVGAEVRFQGVKRTAVGLSVEREGLALLVDTLRTTSLAVEADL